jgi:hypothetical protein
MRGIANSSADTQQEIVTGARLQRLVCWQCARITGAGARLVVAQLQNAILAALESHARVSQFPKGVCCARQIERFAMFALASFSAAAPVLGRSIELGQLSHLKRASADITNATV